MANVLLNGKIFRQPERITAKSGKLFTKAKLREGQGDTVVWWTLLVFNNDDIADELMALSDGKAVAVSGGLKTGLFEKDGQTRIDHTVFVDRIISARKPKRERKPAGDKRQYNSGDNPAPPGLHNDEIPF